METCVFVLLDWLAAVARYCCEQVATVGDYGMNNANEQKVS